LTWDQGSELTAWPDIRIDNDIDVWFCDPHTPWQRGTNENTNGLLRQYFPKGMTCIATVGTTSTPLRWRSTPGPARRWDGRPQQRPSISFYTPHHSPVLRPPVEPKLGSPGRVVAEPVGVGGRVTHSASTTS
jgi:hypothetical protein